MECAECKCPILVHMKYMKNKEGIVLCIDCFKKIIGAK